MTHRELEQNYETQRIQIQNLKIERSDQLSAQQSQCNQMRWKMGFRFLQHMCQRWQRAQLARVLSQWKVAQIRTSKQAEEVRVALQAAVVAGGCKLCYSVKCWRHAALYHMVSNWCHKVITDRAASDAWNQIAKESMQLERTALQVVSQDVLAIDNGNCVSAQPTTPEVSRLSAAVTRLSDIVMQERVRGHGHELYLSYLMIDSPMQSPCHSPCHSPSVDQSPTGWEDLLSDEPQCVRKRG